MAAARARGRRALPSIVVGDVMSEALALGPADVVVLNEVLYYVAGAPRLPRSGLSPAARRRPGIVADLHVAPPRATRALWRDGGRSVLGSSTGSEVRNRGEPGEPPGVAAWPATACRHRPVQSGPQTKRGEAEPGRRPGAAIPPRAPTSGRSDRGPRAASGPFDGVVEQDHVALPAMPCQPVRRAGVGLDAGLPVPGVDRSTATGARGRPRAWPPRRGRRRSPSVAGTAAPDARPPESTSAVPSPVLGGQRQQRHAPRVGVGVAECDPTAWPSARIRRTRAGWARALLPTRKNVPVIPRSRPARSRTSGVCTGSGPSSKVSATACARRQRSPRPHHRAQRAAPPGAVTARRARNRTLTERRVSFARNGTMAR